MGAYESDYIKNKLMRERISMVRFQRTHAEHATSRQIDYLISLGEKNGKAPADTLDWVVHTFVPQFCADQVTSFMDLTKDECSRAIERLKETQPKH